MANPVLVREMRGRWRRPLTFLILLLYAVLLAVLTGLIYAWIVSSPTDFTGEKGARELGRRLFFNFFWMQTCIWALLATVLTATNISGERERGLLEGVLLSPLNAGQIVRGKIAATLGFISVLLLIPMPMSALCFRLGGLAPVEFFLAFLILGSTALSGASLGMAISACHRRSDAALITAIFLALSLNWPPVLVALTFNAATFTLGVLVCVIYQLLVTASALAVATDAVNNLLPEAESENAAISVAALQEALRTSDQGSATRAKNEARAQIGYQNYSWVSMLRFANPVMQREVQARLRRRVEFVPLENSDEQKIVVSTGPLDWILALAIAAAMVSVPALIVGAGRVLVSLWMVFVTLVAAAFGAISFTREREQQTLQALFLALLAPSEVVNGKAGAAGVLALIYGAPFLPIVLVALCTRPLLLLGVLLVTAAEIWLAALAGLTFSWICRKTSVAVGGAISVVLFITVFIGKAPLFYGSQTAFDDKSRLLLGGAISTVFSIFGAILRYILRCRLQPGNLEKDRAARGSDDWNKEIS